jgi:hypothetical protein
MVGVEGAVDADGVDGAELEEPPVLGVPLLAVPVPVLVPVCPVAPVDPLEPPVVVVFVDAVASFCCVKGSRPLPLRRASAGDLLSVTAATGVPDTVVPVGGSGVI